MGLLPAVSSACFSVGPDRTVQSNRIPPLTNASPNHPPTTTTTNPHTTDSKDKIVPRTEMEKRMGEALSNKNWGASSTLMNQISADTFD